MSTKRIVIAGGSGFIGGALAKEFFARGYQVVVLTRTPRARTDGVHEAEWNGFHLGEWIQYLDGAEAVIKDPSVSQALGIQVVYQDLALADSQPVYMNMFLGRELTLPPFGRLDRRRMIAETEALVRELDVRIPSAQATIRDLSGGQRQGVAIARATHWARKLVLMDEPTAALGVAETAKVEKIIEALKARNVPILIVSHSLDQVFRLSDRICVLRRGKQIGVRETAKTDKNEIVSMITGLSA